MPWLLVNKFTVLLVAEYDETSSEFQNTPLYLHVYKDSPLLIKYPKWERWLSLCSTISSLDIKGTFLYLWVELNTMDIYQQHFIWAFLNSGTTESFINKKFVQMHQINTWKISWSIVVFNVDGTANEASQILEAVDMVLQYKMHLEQMLLVVSSLRKQYLILGYS